MKKIILTIITLAIIGLVIWFVKKDNTEIPTSSIEIKTYNNSKLGISFTYPQKIIVTTKDETINLFHDIAYENSGACDMTGENESYPRLTDFDVNIEIIDKPLVPAMKQKSPYIPEENFIDEQVIESPGFIDSYTVGDFSGYSIYEGAEGCGQTAYYFPISNNRTLFITKASIQALSGVRSQEAVNEVLKIPDVISNQKSDEIFRSILENLEVK